ncbi:bifunctional UDP-N-acetylglucosamine diphosphorylase/glucosamine-1-phosphate N-acetyltransferase GlmU [Candidatus Schneideria nysicola]|uniref:bifunctional UDP-N-acetylglucosamine diphosphorylase/glucosamine-1-phosphate N-acetyltransferase GlmU n=1 Tax=Candidatus Schneideria nysicola TaxID=1081631 RepID=UPI001CAA632A|nr:bifunctional UDP-N-acetylglucosamine diphosphorylase/glucosamine-1-phosphate N-acetyltransferase GlmU [Candidatus Schneideria nysicola]UAJ65297.1 bifunctional UDP-N-acetylglucosamine diphosphorylase/glucosamine-1-phosphate N-acetyltransferase GlmU [Candidatus Schneideria nysicola]
MLQSEKISAVILGAGKGTRMHSSLPKVLHSIAGKPMIQHVIDAVVKLGIIRIHLIYGYKGNNLKQKLSHQQVVSLNWISQLEQYGTGHAVFQAIPHLLNNEKVLILYGDVPLITSSTLQRLLEIYQKSGIALITAKLSNPNGYGRIIRDSHGKIMSILEEKNANVQQKRNIKEINTGILLVNSNNLIRWLNHLMYNKKDKECYLTDIISMAWKEKAPIHSLQPNSIYEIQGVNNISQLIQLERIYQKKQAQTLLSLGVMISDPSRFDLRGKLLHGKDVCIDTNVIIEGEVTIGNRVFIGNGCMLKNAIIGDDVIIHPYTLIEGAQIHNKSIVGPFAHLRKGSVLEQEVHIGNFVETKNTRLGKKSKAGHLSYLGDAEIGIAVNIGAGTITCNYDGANKHKTTIRDNVFIGSDSQLIAPLTIENGATIGAGTTVTSDVAENEVIISRIRQFPILNWHRPTKKNKNI